MTIRVGRHVSTRIRARGWLRTEAPLHVGGLGGDPSEPLPIAVDGLGRLYVPGTTLSGVLRQWARGASPDSGAVDEWWGFASLPGGSTPGGRVPPRDGKGGDGRVIAASSEEGKASRVIVADGLITADPRLDERGLPATPLDPALLEVRASVGIDRVTGTAAQEFLYARAVVPAGCHVRLEIDIESPSDGELDEARMGALLAALGSGQVRIGASTGRGLGVVRLLDDPLELVVDRFDSAEGLLAVLRGDPARNRTMASLLSADPRLPCRRETLEVEVTWRPKAPVMVRSAARGPIVDILPLTTRVDRRHLTLVLPGGSIKGMLRSHAELVERTARGVCAPSAAPGSSAADHGAAFRAQLDQLPAVRALFGSARDDRADRRAGALRAEECASLVTIPEALWESVSGPGNSQDQRKTVRRGTGGQAEHAEGDTPERPGAAEDRSGTADEKLLPAAVRDRLADLGMAQAHHVGLDRWTGGAADGRLFTVLEPHAVEWEPIRLAVDLTRLGTTRDTALALLLLTLRDLAAGRIPLGASTNRGFGDIEVTEVTLTGGPWPGPVPLDRALDGPQITSIDRAWVDYLEQGVS